MSGIPNAVRERTPRQSAGAATTSSGRRAARRAETKAEIVAAAWDLVQEHGLAALSMRDLGNRVGMKAQSLYSYFDSKHAIYDAMFLEGYQAFDAWMAPAYEIEITATEPAKALEIVRVASRRFITFCTSDPVRYQLLFQRTIPGFVPSEASYAVAVRVYERMADALSRIGLADQADLDLFTAVMTGLASQQISNDPDGDRWERLVDQAVRMLLRELAPQVFEPSRSGSSPGKRTTRSTR